MNPLRYFHPVAFVIAALLAVENAAPVRADKNTPFSAELFAVFQGQDREAGLFALQGRASVIGAVTGMVRHETRGPRELGVFFIENASGDRLSFSYEVATDTGFGSFEVESGAGRFFGATGRGAVEIHDPLPDGSYPISLKGTIAFGELPFKADLIAVSTGQVKEALTYAIEGDADFMGPVTGSTRHEVRGSSEFGRFVLVDASVEDESDTLVFEYEFTFDPVVAVGTYRVVFGTGRFVGAVGAGVIFVDETHQPGAPFPVTFEGTISF